MMRPLAAWIVLALAAILPHVQATGYGFVFDDVGIIVENPAIRGFDLGGIWGGPYWPQNPDARLYRPLVSTTYAADWALSGGAPWLFHVGNLAIHAAATLAAFWLLRLLFPARAGLAFAAALLFAVHPIHVEAVVGIVGRAESLAALLCLLAYALWIRGERRALAARASGWIPPLLWMLGLLAKESALSLPALLLAHRRGWLSPVSARRGFRAADWLWPAGLLAVLFLRWNALGDLGAPRAPRIDNPLAHVDALHRILGAGGVLARQAVQLLTLAPLSPDYSYAEVVAEGSLLAWGAVALLTLAALAAAAVLRGRRSPAGWGLFFFLAFWILTSNLIVPVGTVQADRLLYLPLLGILAGLCALVAPREERPAGEDPPGRSERAAREDPPGRSERAAGRGRSRPARGQLAVAILAVATLRCAAVSAQTAAHWKDDLTLFRKAVEASPRSVKARSNLAVQLLNRKTPEAAREALEVIEPVRGVAPEYGPLHHREAKARMFLGESARARELFREALRRGADSAEVLIELGNMDLIDGNGEGALAAFEAASRTRERADHVAIGRASALSILGRYAEAAEAWLPVVAALPDSVPVRVACAWNLRMAGRPREAARLLREGLARGADPRLDTALAEADSAAAEIAPR